MKPFFVFVGMGLSALAFGAETPRVEVHRKVQVPHYLIDIWKIKLGLGLRDEDVPTFKKPNANRSRCFTQQQEALMAAFMEPINLLYLYDPGIQEFHLHMVDNSANTLSEGDRNEYLKPNISFDAGPMTSTSMTVVFGITHEGECVTLDKDGVTKKLKEWLVDYKPLKDQLGSLNGLMETLNAKRGQRFDEDGLDKNAHKPVALAQQDHHDEDTANEEAGDVR